MVFSGRLNRGVKPLLQGIVLVKPLVVGIERRHRNIDDFHPANRAMAATGFDQDRGQRFDRNTRAIELHEAVALGF